MAEPHIRPAGPGDGQGCAGIWVDAGRYYQALDPLSFQVPDTDGLAESFERDLAEHDPARLRLIAEVGDAVAGFLVAALHEPGPHPEHELIRDLSRPRVFVEILAVAAAHRRSGVGSALMTAAETWARARGAATVSLNTYLHSPTSVPFYEDRMSYTRRAIVFRKGLDRE